MSAICGAGHAPGDQAHGHGEAGDPPPPLDITWLPDDVLANIFGYLDRAQDRMNAALVCRVWNDLLHEAWLWKEVTFPKEIGADQTLAILREPRMARATRFSFSCALKSHFAARVGELCGERAVKLSFSNCGRKTNLRNDGLRAMADRCQRLEVLFLRGCFTLREGTMQHMPPTLRELDISGCWRIRDTGVIELVRRCPRLEVLSLSGCENITNTALEALAHLPNLRVIKLWSCALITDEGIMAMAERCTKLEHVSLKNTGITDAAIVALATHCPLRHVDLSFCKRISDGSVHALGGVPTLEHIKLRSCAHVSTVRPLLHCRRLSFMDVRGAWRVGSRNMLRNLFRDHSPFEVVS